MITFTKKLVLRPSISNKLYAIYDKNRNIRTIAYNDLNKLLDAEMFLDDTHYFTRLKNSKEAIVKEIGIVSSPKNLKKEYPELFI